MIKNLFFGVKNMPSKKFVTFYKLTDKEIENIKNDLKSENSDEPCEIVDKQAEQIKELEKKIYDLTYCLYEISDKLSQIENKTKKEFWRYWIFDVSMKVLVIVSIIIFLESKGFFKYFI